MRPSVGLPQRITFGPRRGVKKRQIERKVLKRDKYLAINTGGGRGVTREEGVLGHSEITEKGLLQKVLKLQGEVRR